MEEIEKDELARRSKKNNTDGLVAVGQDQKFQGNFVASRGAEGVDTWRETAEREVITTSQTANPAGGLGQITRAKAMASLASKGKGKAWQGQKKEPEQRECQT